MLKRKFGVFLAFLLVAGTLVYGIARLLTFRQAVGDVYPPNSSLRADPLGTKALFDGLSGLQGFSVARNYQPLVRVNPESPVALFYAGLTHNARWEPGELEHFETLIATGSRAIFAFVAEAPRKPEKNSAKAKAPKPATPAPKENEEQKSGAKAKEKEAEEISDDTATTPFADVARRWGFRFAVAESKDKESGVATALLVEAAKDLEPELPWRSALYFEDVQSPWKVLYRVGDRPVLIERSWGQGAIVLAADCFFLSNEALVSKKRPTKLLARLVGPMRHILFDEEHLGFSESSGVATLARKYHLQGLAVALVVLALLFVWQNAVRFVPSAEEPEERADVVPGRGSSEGLVALLRRSVVRSELLATCLREWRRSFGSEPRMAQRLAGCDSSDVRAQTATEIVTAYQALTRRIEQRISSPSSSDHSSL